MTRIFGDKGVIDDATLTADLSNLDEVSDRVRLAGLARAAPLADLRQGQMAREARRAAARFGADDPETKSRAAAAQAAGVRFDQLRTELAEARVTPATPKDGAAAISGLVTRKGQPVADATVTALVGDKPGDFVCTNAAGGFVLPAPAGAPIRLSVSLKAEGELFRDGQGVTLNPDQAIFRHIELEGAEAPCGTPPPTPTPPEDATFPMVQLKGQLEVDARRLVAAQGLVIGARTEKEDPNQIGRVIDQTPNAGVKVKRGDSVAIVVASDGLVEVPQVLGLGLEDARLVLAKSELAPGKLTRKEAPPELEGKVTAQAPKPGERAARKSAVDLQIGVRKAGAPAPTLDPDVARVATLAAHRLAEKPASDDEASVSLDARLLAAKVSKLADLDKLIGGDRDEARTRLSLRTLADTDRLLAALRQARKDLG